jgi:hypothetical protein
MCGKTGGREDWEKPARIGAVNTRCTGRKGTGGGVITSVAAASPLNMYKLDLFMGVVVFFSEL